MHQAGLVINEQQTEISTNCVADSAFAHEGHKIECNDSTSKADVHAMLDGNAKTAAIKEMKAAEDMMQKKDLKACIAHRQNAMKQQRSNRSREAA